LNFLFIIKKVFVLISDIAGIDENCKKETRQFSIIAFLTITFNIKAT